MKIILQAHPPDLSQRQQGPAHFFFARIGRKIWIIVAVLVRRSAWTWQLGAIV